MMETKSIALYCRVSTDEQAHEGISLEEQQVRLTSYCASQGWDQEGVHLYIDDGYSGKNLHRPALERFLMDLERLSFSRLLVTKLDRLSRRLLDLLSLIDLLERRGVSLVSTSEAFDTATPSGRLTLQVLGAVAEFERERIRERVVDNMTHAAKSGKWLAKPPYGYQLAEKALVELPQEAEVVRRIFSLYTEDQLGFFQIAKQLNEEGVASREKKGWSSNMIKKILMNPAYIGTAIWNRKGSSPIIATNAHPALIERTVFEQAQKQSSPPRSIKITAQNRHLLSGFLHCPVCSHRMYAGYSGGRNRQRVYRCAGARTKGNCKSAAIPADTLEAAFLSAIVELFDNWETKKAKVTWKQRTESQPKKQKQRFQALAMQEARLTDAFLSGALGNEEWQAARRMIQAKKEKWQEEQAAWRKFTEGRDAATALAQVAAKDVTSSLAALPVPVLREWLHHFIESVTQEGDKLRIKLKNSSIQGS